VNSAPADVQFSARLHMDVDRSSGRAWWSFIDWSWASCCTLRHDVNIAHITAKVLADTHLPAV